MTDEAGARVMTIDFAKADSFRLHKSGRIRDRGNAAEHRPMSADGKLLTPKQIRARARRKMKSKRAGSKGIMTEQEFEAIYKPIDEWDMEELAHGRPRTVAGDFRGPKPKWINREVHERAMERFVEMTKSEMGALTPSALDSLRWVLTSDETDERGKPIVPAAAKNQASMFLLEHIVGKPKQHIQQDISVKLQGLLGAVMANPNDVLASPEDGGQGFKLAHTPGHTIPLGIESSGDGEGELMWEEGE